MCDHEFSTFKKLLISNQNVFFYKNSLSVIHVGLGNKITRNFLFSWMFVIIK